MQCSVLAVPEIFDELHQGGDRGGGGVACVHDPPSSSQLLLQGPEGLLVGPGEPGGLDLVGPARQSLGAHGQVLVEAREGSVPHAWLLPT